MAKEKDLTKLTDEELEKENFRLQEERAEVEQSIMEQQMSVQAEFSRRQDAARMAALTGAMTDEEKAALRQHLDQEG